MARRQTGGRGRAAVFLVVSLIAALAATAVIYNLIRGMQQELTKAQEKEEMVRVVAASTDLYQGDTIGEKNLVYVELPPDFVPDGTFTDLEEAIGRVPLEPILQHELLRVERLAAVDAGVGLNAIIPRGMRAVSVNTTESSGVSGFVTPGNFVDVIVTIKDEEKSYSTTTLLQAVRVLAVNNQLGSRKIETDEKRIKPSVTLAVSAKDAEMLALAVNEGEVTLTLRNDIDVDRREEIGEVKVANLIGREQIKIENVEASKIAKAKAPPTVRQIKRPEDSKGPDIYKGGTLVGDKGRGRGRRKNR